MGQHLRAQKGRHIGHFRNRWGGAPLLLPPDRPKTITSTRRAESNEFHAEDWSGAQLFSEAAAAARAVVSHAQVVTPTTTTTSGGILFEAGVI